MSITTKTVKIGKHICGFCSTGKRHDLCPGGVLNGNQTEVIVCPCPEHTDQTRCLLCNERGALSVSTTTWACIDQDACQARRDSRRAEFAKALYGASETGEPLRAVPTKEKARKTPPKPEKTPTECRCACGGLTKGGSYLPGHDARHISEVYKRAMATGQSIEDALSIFADKPALQAKLAKRFGA